jgi:membrane protein DedA with SNARE-associated domain
MDDLIARLASVPLPVLYTTLAALAAVENIFPPLPTDVVVAFGSFLAARGHGSVWASFFATWFGNMLGAFFMFVLGRKYGPRIFQSKFERYAGVSARPRLEALYARYGVIALFVSRFLPAVRALVPPFAGAIHLGAGRVMLSIGAASAIWYGFLTIVAFRAGSDWEHLKAVVLRSGKVVTMGAAALVVLALGIWLMQRQRTKKVGDP